ncbi:OLC1v1015205C2 [Oldenlandia corymbosa var. corymbosa]|uniref:OLC1v1015205C2 n=1 Tax=Oldenlandia corymbosa var. corymbosa TaxID=529605 RepID=A0AAV1E2Z6_OLDCO|nr:OLC1v1015205C2 [Oldenlandia corymbosa var. corymbosa]
MAGEGGGGGADFYAVLGLKKECSASEIKSAYKKLALKWHPDRCKAEDAKKKFQAVQQAYSVLSDESKRFLYDVGIYDCDDDDQDANGMADFVNEMVDMMSQIPSNENEEDSFEKLQEMFEEVFQGDLGFSSFSSSCSSRSETPSSTTCSTSSHTSGSIDSGNSTSQNSNNFKRHAPGTSSYSFNPHAATQFEGFCLGVGF